MVVEAGELSLLDSHSGGDAVPHHPAAVRQAVLSEDCCHLLPPDGEAKAAGYSARYVTVVHIGSLIEEEGPKFIS